MRLPQRAPLRLMLLFGVGFALMALAVGYWSILRSPNLLARQDNPRLLLAEERIARGAILDNQNAPLVQSMGAPGNYVRQYLLPEAAPVVGYYSLRYGKAGLEASQDVILAGTGTQSSLKNWWNFDVLAYPQRGVAIRTTLSQQAQIAASNALQGYVGGMVVVNPVSGEILAIASSPGYNPNELDANWERLSKDAQSPLLNRATQGAYPAGRALTPLARLVYQNFELATRQDLEGEQLAVLLGNDTRLLSALQDFALLSAPQIGLPALSPDQNALAMVRSYPPQAFASLGPLRFSPLQLVSIPATLANNGMRVPLQLVNAIGTANGGLQRVLVSESSVAALSTRAAREALQENVAIFARSADGSYYSFAIVDYRLPDQTLPVAWCLGFSADRRYAWALALEDVSESQAVLETFLRGLR